MKNFLILLVVITANIIFPQITQAQQHCQYCFTLDVSYYKKEVVVSSVFSHPVRLLEERDSDCYYSEGRANAERRRALERYTADTTWTIHYESRSNKCNESAEAKAKIEEERLEAIQDEQKNKAREAAAEAMSKQREKEKKAFLQLFTKIEPKPKRILDGWHKVTVIDINDVKQEKTFFVEDNKVTKILLPYLPQFDTIRTVFSGRIKEGHTMIQDGEQILYAYFMDYIKNPQSRAAGPVKDERALWWLKDLNETWQEVISGKKGKAFVGGTSLDFYYKVPSQEDLDHIEQIDRIQLPAEKWIFDVENYANLFRNKFTALRDAVIEIKGNNYSIELSSIRELRNQENILRILMFEINDTWRSLLSGRTGSSYGGFNGDFQVRMDLYDIDSIEIQNLAEKFLRISRINLAPSMNHDDLPVRIFPNLRTLNFQGNSNLYFNDLKRLPEIPALVTIYACDTPAARYWFRKMKRRKKQEQFHREMKAKYPSLDRVEFCGKR